MPSSMGRSRNTKGRGKKGSRRLISPILLVVAKTAPSFTEEREERSGVREER